MRGVCRAEQAAELHGKLHVEWAAELARTDKPPKLYRALWRTFKDMYYIYFVLQVIKSAAMLAQTQFLALLLRFLGSDDPNWIG
jgi:hypothetical protein